MAPTTAALLSTFVSSTSTAMALLSPSVALVLATAPVTISPVSGGPGSLTSSIWPGKAGSRYVLKYWT